MLIFRTIMKGLLIKEGTKRYRTDISRYETLITVFGIFRIYKYEIFNEATQYRFFKIKNPVYFNSIPKTELYIGENTFVNVYKSNKWSIPLNLRLDLSSKDDYSITTWHEMG